MSLLEGLPKTQQRALAQRVLAGYAIVFFFGLGGIMLALRLQSQNGGLLAVAAFFTLFFLHFAAIITGIVLQSRAVRALSVAELTYDADTKAAFDAAKKGIRLGLAGNRYVRAWLVVARYAEDQGALADAEEALARASKARGGRAGPLDKSLLAAVCYRRAFLQAALGRLDEAEKSLAGVGEIADPAIRAEYTRARALLLYKRGDFRRVVDLAASASAHLPLERDRALLAALARSSMLRLEGTGSPMRVAEEPEHDDWIAVVAPELRASRQ
jgi:hypothetical protein